MSTFWGHSQVKLQPDQGVQPSLPLRRSNWNPPVKQGEQEVSQRVGFLGFLAQKEPFHPQLTTVQGSPPGRQRKPCGWSGRGAVPQAGDCLEALPSKTLQGSCPLPISSRQRVTPPSALLPQVIGASPPTHIPVGISLPFPVTRLLASGRHESALTHTSTTRTWCNGGN